MPHARNDRDRHGAQRPREPFGIEGPQVRERPAASHEKNHVAGLRRLRLFKRFQDFAFGRLPLHACRVKNDIHSDARAPNRAHDVSQRRRLRARHNADRLRKARNGPFHRGVKKPLRQELRLQGGKARVEVSFARLLHRADDEVQLASGRINARLPRHLHLVALPRRKRKAHGVSAKEGAAQMRLFSLVLQVKVNVPRRRTRDGVDFAADRDAGKLRREHRRDAAQELGDAKRPNFSARLREFIKVAQRLFGAQESGTGHGGGKIRGQ